MATPFRPGEPSEQKPSASSLSTQQNGAPHDFGGASQGNTGDDEIMRDANYSYDTPSADAENTRDLVLPGDGLPMQPVPLLITAGPSNPDELPHIEGRPPKRPRVGGLEEHDYSAGEIAVELPKSHQKQSIKANQLLAQQVEGLRILHKKTVSEHNKTLHQYQNEMSDFRHAVQERMDQTEAATQADRQRMEDLQAIIKSNADAQTAAAKREETMLQVMQDLKVMAIRLTEALCI